jgi:hypothetical protein
MHLWSPECNHDLVVSMVEEIRVERYLGSCSKLRHGENTASYGKLQHGEDMAADMHTCKRLYYEETWKDENMCSCTSSGDAYPVGPGKERVGVPSCSPAALGVGMDTAPACISKALAGEYSSTTHEYALNSACTSISHDADKSFVSKTRKWQGKKNDKQSVPEDFSARANMQENSSPFSTATRDTPPTCSQSPLGAYSLLVPAEPPCTTSPRASSSSPSRSTSSSPCTCTSSDFSSSSEYSEYSPVGSSNAKVLVKCNHKLDVAVLESVNRDAKSVSGWLHLSLHNLSLTPLERLQYGLNSTSENCMQVGSNLPPTLHASGTGTASQELEAYAALKEPADRSSMHSIGIAKLVNENVIGAEEKIGGAPHHESQHDEHLGDENHEGENAQKDKHGQGHCKDSTNLFRLLVELPSMFASSFSQGKGHDAHIPPITARSDRASGKSCAATATAEHHHRPASKMEQILLRDAEDMHGDGGAGKISTAPDMWDAMLPKGEVVFIDGYDVQHPLRGQLFLDGEELLIPGTCLHISTYIILSIMVYVFFLNASYIFIFINIHKHACVFIQESD